MSGFARTNDAAIFNQKHAAKLESIPLQATNSIARGGSLEASNPDLGAKQLPEGSFLESEAAVELALRIGDLRHLTQSKFFEVREIALCVHVDQDKLPTLVIDKGFVLAQLSELFTGEDSAVVP